MFLGRPAPRQRPHSTRREHSTYCKERCNRQCSLSGRASSDDSPKLTVGRSDGTQRMTFPSILSYSKHGEAQLDKADRLLTITGRSECLAIGAKPDRVDRGGMFG